MDFPLYVHTYELNGRIYRRNPYGGFRSDEEAELRGGDTADLYADDEYDDGPYAAQLTCEMESSKPESKKEGTAPVETVGPPPGFETCAVEGKIASDDSLSSNTGCAESGSSVTHGTVQRASAQEDVREEVAIKFDPRSKKWSTRLEVPYEMIRFVIGAKGSMKRKLELETDCRLVFPDREKKAKYVEIISTKSQESIERCRDRIELMLMSTRERSAFTHFVSIPMNSADIQSAFSQFAELIQNDDDLPASCREPAAFQEVGKLHLTVVMLSLFDETEIGKATSALEAVVKNRVRKVVDGNPVEVEVRGLEYMNDDPTRVRVLYAKAYSEKLQEVADIIADGIGDAGLAPRRSDRVKIHCTLMNTRYAIEKGKENVIMDVEKLMQKYSEFYFGHITVSEVHLSSRVDPKDENGYYSCVASFKLY